MIKQLIDKIVFTVGVIVFIQLPHYVNQYAQRLGGYYESRVEQLKQFQTVANNNYNGNLDLMIDGFTNSQDKAISETGKKIQQSRQETIELAEENTALRGQDNFRKIIYLFTHLRLNIAKGTLENFKPGIPLNAWALLYGLIGGITFSLLFNGLTKVPKLLMRKPARLKAQKT